jgi:hypothetical protein
MRGILALLLALALGGPCASAVSEGGGRLVVDENGDIALRPLPGRSVILQGVDVLVNLTSINDRLHRLETTLQMPVSPLRRPPINNISADAPRVGQDQLGNLVLIPFSSEPPPLSFFVHPSKKRKKRKKGKEKEKKENHKKSIGWWAGKAFQKNKQTKQQKMKMPSSSLHCYLLLFF